MKKKFIIRVTHRYDSDISIAENDYIIHKYYGLCKVIEKLKKPYMRIRISSNQREVVEETNNKAIIYRISFDGQEIGNNVDNKKVIKYILKE